MKNAIVDLKIPLLIRLLICCARRRVSNVIRGKAQREFGSDKILCDIPCFLTFPSYLQNLVYDFT